MIAIADIPEMFRPAAAQVREQGWDIERQGGHLTWTAPDGTEVRSASTPSDRRALYRHVSRLRQAGAVIDGRGAASKPEPVQAEPKPPEPVQAEPEPEPASVAELRELLADVRAALKDLQKGEKQFKTAVTAEVREQVATEVRTAVDDALREAARRHDEALERFAAESRAALEASRREHKARMADANALIAALQARSGPDLSGLSRLPAVPAAFRRPPKPPVSE